MDPLDLEGYAPHILLKEIGSQGQRRLRAATIGFVGPGGPGAPASAPERSTDQTLATAIEPFVPPKPNEFDITMPSTASRASRMMLIP